MRFTVLPHKTPTAMGREITHGKQNQFSVHVQSVFEPEQLFPERYELSKYFLKQKQDHNNLEWV